MGKVKILIIAIHRVSSLCTARDIQFNSDIIFLYFFGKVIVLQGY